MAKRYNPHSIHHEPVYAPPESTKKSDTQQEPALGNMSGRDKGDDIAAQSVWDEVSTRGLGYEVPEDALNYSNWYASRVAQCSILRSWSVVFLVALIGGPLAILGALLGGMSDTDSPLWVAVLWAPILEEQLKVAGALVLLERFPYFYLSSIQLYVAIATSALCFAVIENLLYLNVYIDDPNTTLISWRWNVCTALHVATSSIAFLGVRKIWRVSRENFTPPSVKEALPYFVMATLLHGSYNFFAIILEVLVHPF